MAAVTFSKLVQHNRVRECSAYLGEISADAPHVRIAETIPGSKEYEVINRWITGKGGYKSETLTRPRPLRETKVMAARMLTCGAILGLGDGPITWAEGADRNQIRDHIEHGTPLPGTQDDPITPDEPAPDAAPGSTDVPARYCGEYYRAGSMPQTIGARGGIVNRSPNKAGLFAIIYGYADRPVALVGPFAEVQDMADNLAAWDLPLFPRYGAKHAIKADAERGKLIDARTSNTQIRVPAKTTRKSQLTRVK